MQLGGKWCIAILLAFGVATTTFADSTSCGRTLVTEANGLSSWANRYWTSSRGFWSFLDWPMALECITELSPELREALFDVGDCVGPDCRFYAHDLAAARGLDGHSVAPVAAVIDRLTSMSYRDSEGPWQRIRDEILAAERRPMEDRLPLRERIAQRFRIHHATERFSDKSDAHYRARIEKNELIFPDGARRQVHNGWWGRKYIWVPYREVLRTQEFLNSSVVGRYREKSGLGYWGFQAYLAPDGRVVIIDQHHRTAAYAQRHRKPGTDWEDTPIPILLEKHADGSYRTLTHWNIISSSHMVPNLWNSRRWRDPDWNFLEPAERERMLVASRTAEKIPAILNWYYESTGLTRLAPKK